MRNDDLVSQFKGPSSRGYLERYVFRRTGQRSETSRRCDQQRHMTRGPDRLRTSPKGVLCGPGCPEVAVRQETSPRSAGFALPMVRLPARLCGHVRRSPGVRLRRPWLAQQAAPCV